MRKSLTIKLTEQFESKGLDFIKIEKSAKAEGLTVNAFVLTCLAKQMGLVYDDRIEAFKREIIDIVKRELRNER